MLEVISWVVILAAALTLYVWARSCWEARKARERMRKQRERLAEAMRQHDGYDSEGWPV